MREIVAEAAAQNLRIEGEQPGDPPLIEDDAVLINGGCETFFFSRVATERERFLAERLGQIPDFGFPPGFGGGFCKTRGLPYDAVVCAVLLAAVDRFGDDVRVSSDGEWPDWSAGRALYQRALHREPKNPLHKEED